jgi:hypothetical protein
VLPDQIHGPGGPLPVRAPARPGNAAPCARAWHSGCLILVPGSGSDPALAATAGAAPRLAVVAAGEVTGARIVRQSTLPGSGTGLSG